MSTLADLVHHRWALPVIAELDRGRGGRFVNLLHTLGISRESLRRTLAALETGGLIERNPGHGHPLRPEYLLTAAGSQLAGQASIAVELMEQLHVGGKWSLPILQALGRRQLRYSELRNALPSTSPRALTLALKDLEAAGALSRLVTSDYPPATVYRATDRALPLSEAATELAVILERGRPGEARG